MDMSAERGGCEFAAVCLLDNPYSIDNKYDYFIPQPLRDKIRPGVFVTVPFGKGNRKHMAMVLELRLCPEYTDTKSLSGVCHDRMALDESMLSLAEYIREQYLCTWGDAVRCMLPPMALGKMTEYYYPTSQKAPNSSSGFEPADLFVFEYICSYGGRSAEQVKVKFGAGVADQSLKKLLARGIIKKEIVATKSVSDATEDYYSLAQTREECLERLQNSKKMRSEKQKAVLEALLDGGEAISAKELKQITGAESTHFKALCEKGFIKLEKRRVWRDSATVGEEPPKEYKLNKEQSEAFEAIRDRLDGGVPSAILLHGVTGSGKTSVIMKAIDHCLEGGRGAILLLPEIALTPQTLRIFSARYGDKIALIHSGLSAGERFDSYERIRAGEARLVIGTRSAIFAPVKDLGLVVIDEEHEGTYKSEISPKYHARDIARFRCAKEGAVMLLSSATPSIESYTKAMEGKYTLLKLTSRYGKAALPEVEIYDMRGEVGAGNLSPVSSFMKEKLREVTGRGEQAVLFLNRRGYNTSVSCKSCGEPLTCPRCSISLNFHTGKGSYDNGYLLCHQCGYRGKMPERCPSCSSEHLVKIGFGTQRIEQEISELLPDKKIIRMDADSTSGKNSHDELLASFKAGEADVLLGTQMVTKGHDFPGVTLVGVLLADMSLYVDDYHANERTFSMLTQVIGRAGRAEKKGLAVIQTSNPDNDVIKLACRQDYESFYASEIRLRKLLVFPPYCDIALLNVTGADEKQVLLGAGLLHKLIDMATRGEYKDVEMIIFGPFEAPIYKVDGKYRMRMVIKCRLNRRSRALFSELLKSYGKQGGKTSLSVDFNPSGL